MSHNTFGHLFRLTTWGESHGPALGAVIDGCPPGLALSEADIQPYLDKRRPGTSRHVTQRREADEVRILSGTFEDERTPGPVTTGSPISLMIENTDQRSKDYSDIRDRWRPGHADFTYDMKYGVRDYKGGGRSSARETAARVAAGAIARKVLGDGISIRAVLVQIGPRAIDRTAWDWAAVEQNDFFCPDPGTAARWAEDLDEIRKAGSSVGAMVECHVSGVPAGWGAPVYGKLDADLASAMMSINAAKGVEIGAGMEAAAMRGEDAADEMRLDADGKPAFSSNHNGGVLGGISTGQDLVVRLAIKPTSSIRIEKQTLTRSLEEVAVSTKGRHDPCVGIRAVPVAEAMAALVLADHKLRALAQNATP
ncbi:chorismate synthase [Marinicauda pacifica]|uniref:chorismate synthase n=1 Tax=Marinicauda pacifica TaxID=1133559 RepID=UPI0035C82476